MDTSQTTLLDHPNLTQYQKNVIIIFELTAALLARTFQLLDKPDCQVESVAAVGWWLPCRAGAPNCNWTLEKQITSSDLCCWHRPSLGKPTLERCIGRACQARNYRYFAATAGVHWTKSSGKSARSIPFAQQVDLKWGRWRGLW